VLHEQQELFTKLQNKNMNEKSRDALLR